MVRHTKVQAYAIFFPAAALYAALAIPLSVHAMTSGTAWPAGLAGSGHAHEMLFGFALALIAGYLLGPIARLRLVVLFGLWLAARLSYLADPGGTTAMMLSPLFALVLAAHIAPKFLIAKKWRNRMISPLLTAICLLPAIYAASVLYAQPVAGDWLLLIAIILLALLMAFMGGRVIAPAAAGEYYQRGINLESRVQPRLEAALIILLVIAACTVALPQGGYIAGSALAAAGLVAIVRLFRWRLWRLGNRPDLIGLGIGYGWLALGLLMLGGLILLDRHTVPAVHVITIGALGTLSICITTRIHFQRIRHDPARAPLVSLAITLIAAATLFRWLANLDFDTTLFLWISAASWSLAYLVTAFHLLSGTRLCSPSIQPTLGGNHG